MEETLTITDNRTGKTYTVPIFKGNIRTMDLRQIKVDADDFGVMGYDPAFMNTASCQSSVTFIDGDKGILEYRGYPIEDLAEKCSFLEVAYLVLNGELPTKAQLDEWVNQVKQHTMVDESIKKVLDALHHDAHPMGTLVTTLGALSTFYPEARNIHDPKCRQLQILRLIAKVPTLAAYAYRHGRGLPYVYPDNSLSYTENFMSMLWKMTEPKYNANPVLARALDILFILHADHEQNCSANAMRSVGSSYADPYVSAAGAAAALSGPLHGGANEEVLKMLDEIGTKDNIPAFVEQVKTGKGKLMGFGHRVYKNYDPRARIIKRRGSVPGHRTQPQAGHGHRTGEDRAVRRILHQAQALSQRRFLLRHHLPGHGLHPRHLHRAVCHPADGGLAVAMAGIAHRQGAEDRPSAPDLHRRTQAPGSSDRAADRHGQRQGLIAVPAGQNRRQGITPWRLLLLGPQPQISQIARIGSGGCGPGLLLAGRGGGRG
jgi:citrate synthase